MSPLILLQGNNMLDNIALPPLWQGLFRMTRSIKKWKEPPRNDPSQG